MTDQSMVNVAVVERATPPLEPENGLLMPLMIGLLGGLGVAAGMAIAVEYVNRTLRFEEEVERYLELPVLAVIPDLETTAAIARA
jgi:capsular polysaccharide biosynthesis protein